MNRLSQPPNEEKTPDDDHDDDDGHDGELCEICYGDGGHCYHAVAGCIQCGQWLCGVHVAAHRREKHKCAIRSLVRSRWLLINDIFIGVAMRSLLLIYLVVVKQVP